MHKLTDFKDAGSSLEGPSQDGTPDAACCLVSPRLLELWEICLPKLLSLQNRYNCWC